MSLRMFSLNRSSAKCRGRPWCNWDIFLVWENQCRECHCMLQVQMNHRWSKLGHNVHTNWFQIWTRQCHLKAKRKYMSAVLWRKLDQGCLATAFEVLWGGVFSDILSKHWRGDGGSKKHKFVNLDHFLVQTNRVTFYPPYILCPTVHSKKCSTLPV